MERSSGLTLDSGALIGIERNKRRAVALVKAALLNRMSITVPTVVVAETWRAAGSRPFSGTFTRRPIWIPYLARPNGR